MIQICCNFFSGKYLMKTMHIGKVAIFMCNSSSLKKTIVRFRFFFTKKFFWTESQNYYFLKVFKVKVVSVFQYEEIFTPPFYSAPICKNVLPGKSIFFWQNILVFAIDLCSQLVFHGAVAVGLLDFPERGVTFGLFFPSTKLL